MFYNQLYKMSMLLVTIILVGVVAIGGLWLKTEMRKSLAIGDNVVQTELFGDTAVEEAYDKVNENMHHIDEAHEEVTSRLNLVDEILNYNLD